MLPDFEPDTAFEFALNPVGNDDRDEALSLLPYLLPPQVAALTV